MLSLLLAAVTGAVLTLLLQYVLLFRRSPEPVPPVPRPFGSVEPDDTLRVYFNSAQQPPIAQTQQQQEAEDGASSAASAASAAPSAASAAKGPAKGPDAPESLERAETCHFLNAIFLFLFRELRDTAAVRHWLTKKIKVEFEELLQTKTAGRLLEGLSLRDISLGNSVPVFKSTKIIKPVSTNHEGLPEELNFEVDLEYNGGFHLAIDVDLVFGKSAYLFVKLRRVVGRLRLQFTRIPFTHWSFSFLHDPLVDMEVKSQFEGRPLPQLTSIIVNQLKRVIKRKHTLPNYKIRYKPFFPFQLVSPLSCDLDLSLSDTRLVEGRLRLSLVECSRLFILGSYDRETFVHCTVELSATPWKEKTRSSIKQTEVIKGPCGSVGMTFRQVPASEGDMVHVSIETVTPNSPAAQADLQRGDRLIAIGGVKVTSSVQVPKLLKAAGDRVLVLYERPVGHQNVAPESYASDEPPPAYEEEPAPICALTELHEPRDPREMDSEFEELTVEARSPPPTSAQTDLRDECLLSASPKRSAVSLASKPLGSISPILSRKLQLVGLQAPLRPQPSPKHSPHRSSCELSAEGVPRPSLPPVPPPVPPRPHIRLTSASSETSLTDTAEGPGTLASSSSSNALSSLERSPEKTASGGDAGEEVVAARAEHAKEKLSESSCSTSLDEHAHWESAETLYKSQNARWSKASALFDVEAHHKYLNVALWCKDPFKLGALLCLGHASLPLEQVALECLATASSEFQSTFRLRPPEPRANVSRTALRSLSAHKGFNEKLCYGDVTLNLCYGSDTEAELGTTEREREDDCRERERETPALTQRDELLYGALQMVEVRHNFQDTQFQNPTWCEYCKKKVWTKAASQCMVCAYVCHKKCQDKCLAEHPLCVAASERKSADPEAKSTINRATSGLTRHILNTSSRLLNLRTVPRPRQAEPEPSPKQTPNTSDNESSDAETYAPGTNSNSSTSGAKLVRKDGGLDDSVFIAVKEIGRDLYRGLPTDERAQKLELMLDKLQQEIDQELEHNNTLLLEERDAPDARRKAAVGGALSKSGERLQALTLLTIHYRAGIEDLETTETAESAETGESPGDTPPAFTAEEYDSDTSSPVEVLHHVGPDRICGEASI